MPSPFRLLLAVALLLTASVLYSQPANDECSGATFLSVGANPVCDDFTVGTTLGAGYSGSDACGLPYSDVWYMFIATTGAHTVSVSNAVDTFGNPVYFQLEFFSGNCSGLVHSLCSGWYYQEGSLAIGDFSPGDTCYIRVTNPYNQTFNFNICVGTAAPPPANDACAGAIVLTPDSDAQCDASVSGSTDGATASPVPVCNVCQAADDDVWYTFTATQANHGIDFFNIRDAAMPDLPRYLEVNLFSGTCNSLTNPKGGAFYGQGSDLLTGLVPGETYYLRIHSGLGALPLTFDLCITSPPPPPNDECAGAETVNPSTDLYCYETYYGSTYLATSSADNCGGGTSSDVWFQFVASSPAHRILMTPAYGSGYGFEVYGDSCADLAPLGCANGYSPSKTLNGLTPGSTYYIRAFSPEGSWLNFGICVQTLPSPPANDSCNTATILPVNADVGCNLATNGATLGATSDMANCAGTLEVHDVWYAFTALSDRQRITVTPNITVLGDVSQFGYEVFGGDCDAPASLACKSYFNDYSPVILSGLTPGATYFIRAYSENGSAHEFSICVSTVPAPPPNATCATSAEIIPSTTFDCNAQTAGTTAGVEVPDPGYCFTGMSVWYHFTATYDAHIIRVSDVENLNGNGLYAVEVYAATDCNSLFNLKCEWQGNNMYVDNLVVGQQYYIRWSSESYGVANFNICVGSTPPPPNDECAGATVLAVDTDLECDSATPGSTLGGTSSPSPSSCFSTKDVWYRFTATQASHQINLSEVLDILYNNYNYATMELLSDACPTAQSLYCWTLLFYGGGTFTAGELTPGQDYLIRVANPFEVPMNFNICVLTPPPPPANDACANAIPLPVEAGAECLSPVAGTTQYSTLAPGAYPDCCGANGDVWYTFVAANANHSITLSGITDPIYGYQTYAQVSVFTGACDSLILKNSQLVYDGAANFYFTHLEVGTTYHIRVAPYYAQAVNFNICITTPAQPANDECTGALPLPINEDLECANTLIAQTYGATQSLPTCGGGASNDLWYQFVATTNSYRIDINVLSGDYNEWGYEVFSGDCDNPVSINCSTPAYSAVQNLSGLTAGVTYYLRLFSTTNKRHELTICTRALPPAPVNDVCTAAIPLTIDPDMVCDVPQTGTTINATESRASCFGIPTHDVWYSFVATGATQLLDIAATASYFGGSNYELGFEVTSAECDNPVSLKCQDYLYQNIFVIQGLIPGDTYYLRVFSKLEYAHDFSVCLMTLPPPPANDLCEAAEPMQPNEGLTCDNVYSGTTLGATANTSPNQMDVWYTFTATAASHVFEFSNLQVVLGYSYTLYCNIFAGDDCNALQYFAGFNSGSPFILGNLQVGETYYLQIYPDDPNSAYTFDFCIKSLPPSPPNETCVGAYELTPNAGLNCDIMTSGTTAGASTSDYYSCGYGNDIWYKFVATSPNHQVQANNIALLLGSGGFTIGLFQGSDCNNLVATYCVYGSETMYLTGLTTGATYYVRVSSDYGSIHSFDLCIRTIPPPPNDLCSNAIALDVDTDQSCDNFISGTSAGSSPSGFYSICNSDFNDVWYSFTATQAAHTISLTNITDALWGYATFASLEIYTGACESLQYFDCRSNINFSDFYTLGDLIPGQTYLIRLMTNYPNGINFDLCVGTPPPPPLNDVCINAQELPVSSGPVCETPTTGTLQNATPTPGNPYYSSGMQYNDVWYHFTATGSNHVVELSNLSYPANLNMEVLTGVCGTLTSLGMQNTYYSNQLFLTHLVAGNTYYVRVAELDNQPISFDICVLSIPQPPNDECATATVLNPGEGLDCTTYATGSTYGATQSQPGCYDNNVGDIWYQFVATGPSHLVNINASGGSGYYSEFGLEILAGICDGFVPLSPCEYFYYTGYVSRLLQNLVEGNTYYIRLFSNQNNYKDFNLCIQTLPDPPANDECAQAVDIQANEDMNCTMTYTGTTLGATQSALSCYGANTHDVWYRFAATGASQLINLTTITPLLNDGFLGLEVYSGDACDNLQSLHCDQYASNNSTIVGGLTEGAFYYIRVFSFYGSAHEFSLCIRTLPPPPANETCADAQEVTPSPDMSCAFPTAGYSNGLGDYNYTGCTYGPDVWYRFTAIDSRHIIRLQNVLSLYGGAYLALELYQGDNCDQLSLLQCSYGGWEIYAPSLVAGETYYVRVIGSPYSGTGFDLCVLTVPPVVNDDCSTATMLPVASGVECVEATFGTTLGATFEEPVIGYCNTGVDVWYSFVATSTAHMVMVNNFQPYFGATQMYYEVLNGDCESWTSLGCYPAYSSPALTELTPGQTYYVHLGSYGSEYYSFNVCVTTALPDLGAYAVYPLSNGCAPGTNETVDAYFVNQGSIVIPAGAAVFELEVISPVGSTLYGPLANSEPIYPGNISYASFAGVDLSVPGLNQITVTGSVSTDYNPSNDALGVLFYSTQLDTFYLDSDLDGYGDPGMPLVSCFQYEGYSADNTDCNDYDAYIHPGASEFCNGYDDDCDGLTDGDDPGVIDTLPPTISCPANVLTDNDSGLCSAIVDYGTVSASDDCSYTLEQTTGLASGQAFPVGITTNTFVATDAGGNAVSCSFTVEILKSADPDLLYAYTVIGFKEVQLRKNTVASGGVGVTSANKKVILQSGTTVTAANTFVKSPDLLLQGGSQVTTWYQGQADAALLPAFQPNNNPGNNNVSIANNSAPVVLGLASYGKITVGNNVTVTFSGHTLVKIKELQVGNDATVLFAQGTELLIDKKMEIGKRTDINPGSGHFVQFFAEGEVSIDRGCDVSANIYTQKTLDVLQATAAQPTLMAGLFIAEKVNAKEHVTWNTDGSYCPVETGSRALAETGRAQQPAVMEHSGQLALSPNPATDEVYVTVEWPQEGDLTISLRDATGRLVRSEKTAAFGPDTRYRLGLAGLPGGIYTVQVTDGLRQESAKLLLVR